MVMQEKPAVALNADPSPITSKLTSVRVAMLTPNTMGNKDRYVLVENVWPQRTLEITTVKKGMVALTVWA